MKELEVIEKQINELAKLCTRFFMCYCWPQAIANENGDLIDFKYVWQNEDAEKQFEESKKYLKYLNEKKMKYIEEHRRMRYEILHGM